jgi:GTP:adenosylcobinamide-phosphate guanylyltransferase
MTGEDDRQPAFTAVVLAGDRGEPDALTTAAGAPCKALVPVGGTPMVLRVLDALGGSAEIGPILLSGPPRAQLACSARLDSGVATGQWGWRPPEATPSASAYAALQSLPPTHPVLVTTADHALLRAEVVDYFCAAARRSGCDLAFALADHAQVMSAFPGVGRTALRFRGGTYCGCNLYAFLTPEARGAADFWRRVERDRKRPWRMISGLGWMPLLYYAAGRLSLNAALRLLSDRLGLRIAPIMLPFPEAAVDVDKPSDKALAERILSARADPAPG